MNLWETAVLENSDFQRDARLQERRHFVFRV